MRGNHLSPSDKPKGKTVALNVCPVCYVEGWLVSDSNGQVYQHFCYVTNHLIEWDRNGFWVPAKAL